MLHIVFFGAHTKNTFRYKLDTLSLSDMYTDAMHSDLQCESLDAIVMAIARRDKSENHFRSALYVRNGYLMLCMCSIAHRLCITLVVGLYLVHSKQNQFL